MFSPGEGSLILTLPALNHQTQSVGASLRGGKIFIMSNKSGNILIFPHHVKPGIFSIKLFSISWPPPSPQTLLTDMKGRSKLWQEIDGAFYIHLMCEEGESVIHSESMFSLLPVVCITRRRWAVSLLDRVLSGVSVAEGRPETQHGARLRVPGLRTPLGRGQGQSPVPDRWSALGRRESSLYYSQYPRLGDIENNKKNILYSVKWLVTITRILFFNIRLKE